MGRQKIKLTMKKLNLFFIPDSHKRICESGLSGLWHIENGSDVDGLQALQAVSVLNVRWRIARRSRAPQMDIFQYAIDRPSEKGELQNYSRNNGGITFNNTGRIIGGKNVGNVNT
jgi:hypothetical protein